MKLAVEQRVITGKKVAHLRKEDKIPGVVYGRHLDQPISLTFDRIQLVKSFRAAGRSTPVELQGEGVDYLVLFHQIQFHPVSDAITHVDFLAVNKDEKTRAEVPVKLIGESPFEKDSLGRVQLLKTRLEVEALPLDLPHDIEIDISNLTEEGQVVHISDVVVGEKVELVEDPTLAVLSTVAFREEIEEEEEVELTEGEEGEEGEGEEDMEDSTEGNKE